MQIVYFLFTLYLIFNFSCNGLKDNKYLYIVQFTWLIISVAIFFGFRDQSIGNDSITYIKIFQNPGSYPSRLEPGYLMLNSFLHLFSKNGNFYLFFASLLLAILQLKVYKNIDAHNYLLFYILYACFYYFYQFHFNIIREGIAITFVSLSLLELKSKKYFQYFLLGLLAVSIHITALIFVIYPLFLIPIKTRKIQISVFLILILLFSTNIVSVIIKSIPDFHWAISKIKWYFIIAEPVKIKQSHFISMLIMLVYTINYEKMKKTALFYLYSFHSVYFTFLAFFNECVLVYDRFYFYIQVFEPVLLFGFINLFKEKKIFKFLYLLFCLVVSFFTVFIWGPRNFIQPYSFLN